MQTAQIKLEEDTKISQVIQNAAQFPEIFYCRHMFPGLAGYEDEDILIDADAMKKMLPSFVGKPVYVEHQEVDLKNLQKDADGFIVDSFYNPNDGWAWAKFIAVSDAGIAAVRKGWSVSNAYKPMEWGSGGSFHNVDYDRKIVNAQFTHLALVPNPRYENAQVFTPDEFKSYQAEKQNELRNSKSGDEPMFKIFNSKTEEVKNASEINENSILKDKDGVQRSVGEMWNAIKKNEEDEKKKKEEEDCMNKKKNKKNDMEDDEFFNDEQDVNIGDIKMPLKELVSKFNAVQEKKNAEKEKMEKENADKEEKEKEAKKNAEEKEKAEEKKNAKYYDELKNARESNGIVTNSVIELSTDKLARGKIRYGSPEEKKQA